MHRSLPRLTRALAAAASVVAVASCGSSEPGNSVKDYFSAVQAVVTTAAAPIAPSSVFQPSVGGKTKADRPLFSFASTVTINASFHSGTPPTAGGGPGISEAGGLSTPLLGQPYRYGIVGSGDFSKVYIWIDGVDGYWELDLPVSVSELQLVLQMTENAGSSLDLMTAVSGTGGVGAAHSEAITTTDLSNADIVATVKWHNASDVDLHVIDPNGVEVFFGHTSSPEGGSLNLDMNAACEPDDNTNPQETISWPHGTAPAGQYTVIVEYYAACGATSTPFTGTLKVNGQDKTFTGGTFTGEAGDNNPAHTSATFTF